MRLPRFKLAVAVATAGLLVPAAAQAASRPDGPPHRAVAAHCTPAVVQPGSTKATGCYQLVRQPARELSPARVAAVRQALTTSRGAPAAAGTPPSPPGQCAFTPPSPSNPTGTFVRTPDRFTSCILALWTLTSYASDNTTVLGTFQWSDLGWASFSVSSVHWTHGLWIIPESSSGSLANGTVATLINGCGVASTPPTPTLCTATGIDGTPSTNPLTLQLTPNAGSKLAWDEADTHAAGDVDILDGTIGEDWTVANGEKVSGEPESIYGSCDYEGTTLGALGAPQGCVDERYVPTLVLPRSQYGSAAAMYQWAQNNLQSHWGLQTGPGQYDGNPLRRMYNPTQANTNRGVICPSSFPKLPSIGAPFDTDSCDEFPFAATYESGAMDTGLGPKVTSGNQCVQASAVKSATGTTEPEVWNGVTVGANSGNTFANCIRGHIPAKENSDVGTAYSTFIVNNRLLDNDPFWIAVTS